MTLKDKHNVSMICMLMAVICGIVVGFFETSQLTNIVLTLLGAEFLVALGFWIYVKGALDERGDHENRPKNRPMNRILRDL